MKLSDLLPPGDLLKKVEGIESGLQQRYRLGIIGLITALIQLVFLIANNEWVQTSLTRSYTPMFKHRWPLLLILTGAVFSLLIAGWARFWLEESQSPFRYTYSIADFKPVIGEKEGGKDDKLTIQLPHDLTHRLTERIKRLSLLDDGNVQASAEAQAKLPEAKRKSHIHIKGNYLIRQNPQRQWFVEVMPQVRIGPPGSPETLAHKVRFKLSDDTVAPPNATADANAATPSLSPRQYEQILERVYFSVATEIYKQIQQDVKRKIELLPNDYYRAVALFHEAEDYARSNTFDAYTEAMKLYEEAFKSFVPSLRTSYEWKFLRIFQRCYYWFSDLWLRAKRLIAYPFPTLGKVELMCARAEIGYVNMMLYRNNLASIAAQRLKPVFEARPVAKRAVRRLEKLPRDVLGRDESLFDAYVTLAYAWQSLGSNGNTEKCLKMARRMSPARAGDDAKYLHVDGNLLVNRNEKLHRYRRAVEINPRFDTAQFFIAVEMEMDWRERTGLERSTAEIVIREYTEVLKINPGNVSAWTNIGYVRWLLGDTEKAREAFESGREYKDINRETYVAEFDYGLARIAAEEGDFESAYQYFDNGVSALMSQGVVHSDYGHTYHNYHYESIAPAIMDRFKQYLDKVSRHRNLWNAAGDQDRSWEGVVETLKDQRARAQNVECLAAFLKCVAGKLSKSERDKLAEWIQSQSVRAEIKEWLLRGDLYKFADQIGKLSEQQWDDMVGVDLRKILSHSNFGEMIRSRVPNRRVKNSVQAFVLDDYGIACYRHYSRSGESGYLDRSREAYLEATRMKEDYALPYYHLFQWVEPDDKYIERVVKLAPDWPDGKMALSNHLLRKRKRKEERREEAISDAKKKSADASSYRVDAEKIKREVEYKENELKEKRKRLKKSDDTQLPSELGAGSIKQLDARRFLSEGQEPSIGAESGKALESDAGPQGGSIEPEDPGSEIGEGGKDIELLKSQIKELEKLVGDLSDKSEELRETAENLEKEVEDSEKKAADLKEELREIKTREDTEIDKYLRDLLPYKWLWAADGKTAKPKLDWKTLDRKNKIARELKWEREFNALSATAFLTWAQVRAKQESELKRMLDHFQEHFWAEHVEALFILRRLSGDDVLPLSRRVYAALNRRVRAAIHQKTLVAINRRIRTALKRKIGVAPNQKIRAARNRVIREVIDFWARSDTFSVIEYGVLDDKAFNFDQQFALCRKIAEAENLSPHNCKLLGDKLFELIQKKDTRLLELNQRVKLEQMAYGIYRRALSTDDPRLLLDLGKAFEKLEMWDDALKAYQRAKGLDLQSSNEWRLRIGRNRLAKGDLNAIGEFDAFGKMPPNITTPWRTKVAEDSLSHIVSIDSYCILKSWLEREREKCLREKNLSGAQDAQSAILLITREKYLTVNAVPAGASASEMYSVATPIVVEAHDSLVKDQDQRDQLWSCLVATRDRVSKDIGIRLPGVTLRGAEDEFLLNSYIIIIDEAPLVLGKVEQDNKFFPRYYQNDQGHFNPLTGENDGKWLGDQVAKSEVSGKESWDHYQYAAYHLESVLRSDLTPFIGLQETRELIDRWQEEGGKDESERRRELAADVLRDTDSLLRFTQLLRGLVKESVPVKNLMVILNAFHDHGLNFDNPFQAIESVRLRLKGELTGNNGESEFLCLSPEFEKEIENSVIDLDGKRFFAIQAEPTQDLLAAFRNGVGHKKLGNLVIVTRAEGIRPFVRRLIELEFPRVKVLSWQEMRPELRGRIAETIHYP